MSRIFTADLGTRSYPIHIGPGLLERPEILTSRIAGPQVMVVTNETLAPLYLDRVERALGAFQTARVVLPDGEKYKTPDSWSRILDELLGHRYARDCTLVALGGGVIGDLAGFAAACYQRGVALIQLPTSLLAQVDSSVGGDDLRLVAAGALDRIGERVRVPGAQLVHVRLEPGEKLRVPDQAILDDLGDTCRQLAVQQGAQGVRIRDHGAGLVEGADHVLAQGVVDTGLAADELEAGERALLNLGHTFGHAIETGVGYDTWLHGEAVGVGMCMAADLSARLGWLDTASVRRIRSLIAVAGLPVTPPAEISPIRFRELMARDKKTLDNRLRLVLLQDIGRALVTADFDPTRLDEMLVSSCPQG